MSHFQQHYAQLHDEALMEIALTRELTPEATEALQAELARRGNVLAVQALEPARAAPGGAALRPAALNRPHSGCVTTLKSGSSG